MEVPVDLYRSGSAVIRWRRRGTCSHIVALEFRIGRSSNSRARFLRAASFLGVDWRGYPRLQPPTPSPCMAGPAALAADDASGRGAVHLWARQSRAACHATAAAVRHADPHPGSEYAIVEPETRADTSARDDALRLPTSLSDGRLGAVPAPVHGGGNVQAIRCAIRTDNSLAEPCR